MKQPTSAAGRLALLMPWLNGQPTSPADVVDALRRFVSACQRAWGGVRNDFVGLYAPRESGSPFRADRLDKLRTDLASLLSGAEEPRRLDPNTMRALPSLRFHLFRAQPSAKRSSLARHEKRDYLGPGAYRIAVMGELEDLVVHCVMRTVTEAGGALVGRCPAPAPRNWSARCGKLVVAGGRGRPREYCSLACRVRHHDELNRQDAAPPRAKGARRK